MFPRGALALVFQPPDNKYPLTLMVHEIFNFPIKVTETCFVSQLCLVFMI